MEYKEHFFEKEHKICYSRYITSIGTGNMQERKKFDIVTYFLEKYNIKEEIAVNVNGLKDFHDRFVHYYGMNMPITFDTKQINESGVQFEIRLPQSHWL